MQIANEVLTAIDTALEADDGARFRALLGEAVQEIGDAFNGIEDTHPRTHLGASIIGRPCPRAMWYSFRWVSWRKPPARIVRLFNRGHMEEARFLALLRLIGATVHGVNPDTGKQFRVSAGRGYYGGSLDAMCLGLPGFTGWALAEFKTHGDNSFKKLQKIGMREAKPEHYVQMQQYMGAYQLSSGLYLACNKNDDALHAEIVLFDRQSYLHYRERGELLVDMAEPPPRCSQSPSNYDCKTCDHAQTCFYGVEPLHTCRTCQYATRPGDGKWHCEAHRKDLTPDEQFAGCGYWAKSYAS